MGLPTSDCDQVKTSEGATWTQQTAYSTTAGWWEDLLSVTGSIFLRVTSADVKKGAASFSVDLKRTLVYVSFGKKTESLF